MEPASSRAFQVVELVENILAHLEHSNGAEMVRLQRVNTTWYTLIREIFGAETFREPQDHRRYAYWQKLEDDTIRIIRIIDKMQPPWPEDVLCMEIKQAHPILKGRMIRTSTEAEDAFVTTDFSKLPVEKDPGVTRRGGIPDHRHPHHRYKFTVYQVDDVLLATLPRGGSWETSLACQPPAPRIDVRLEALGTGREVQRFCQRLHGVKENEEGRGVTLGQMRDRIDSEIAKSLSRMVNDEERSGFVLTGIRLVTSEMLIVS